MHAQSPSLSKIHSGGGRLAVSFHANRAVISELSSTYPLKLLSPYIHDATALVYLLTYGGGLVGGDEVNLDVNIGPRARLLLLSQGTTKVFKTRLGQRLASVKTIPSFPSGQHVNNETSVTKQNIRFYVSEDSLLMLLPEPVTCFRDASYLQCQQFIIHGSGSAVILDWITSGRMSLGEEWAFSRYHSVNEILHNGVRIAKDVMLLDNNELGGCIPNRPLRDRLTPYSCYAMLFLYGPQVQHVVADITNQYSKITVFKTRTPDNLIWSLSTIDSEKQGVVVRVAGLETENVKDWLRELLSSLEEIIGRDAYRRAFL